jgi:hypothetical protein
LAGTAIHVVHRRHLGHIGRFGGDNRARCCRQRRHRQRDQDRQYGTSKCHVTGHGISSRSGGRSSDDFASGGGGDERRVPTIGLFCRYCGVPRRAQFQNRLAKNNGRALQRKRSHEDRYDNIRPAPGAICSSPRRRRSAFPTQASSPTERTTIRSRAISLGGSEVSAIGGRAGSRKPTKGACLMSSRPGKQFPVYKQRKNPVRGLLRACSRG